MQFFGHKTFICVTCNLHLFVTVRAHINKLSRIPSQFAHIKKKGNEGRSFHTLSWYDFRSNVIVAQTEDSTLMLCWY